MKLSDAQYNTLHTLAQHGMKTATEVILPPKMDGSARVKLEWNVATAATLAKLEAAGLVSVTRSAVARPVDAVGRRGHGRRSLTIEISEAGRAAINGDVI